MSVWTRRRFVTSTSWTRTNCVTPLTARRHTPCMARCAGLRGVVLKDLVRRDQETGEARHVRVTVDATKEYGFCLRHACVDFDWAPDPNAHAHVAPVTPIHLGVWRRGQQTHPKRAYANHGDRGCDYRPRSPRRECSRSSRRDRSRSASPPHPIEATWLTHESSPAAIALFESALVRDVRLRGPRGAAVSAVAHAWVDQNTGLRRAVERADGRGVESASFIIGQAVARAVLERHAQRRCKPCCCKKQNSRNQVLTGFEPPTPGRDPKVAPNESGCLTSH